MSLAEFTTLGTKATADPTPENIEAFKSYKGLTPMWYDPLIDIGAGALMGGAALGGAGVGAEAGAGLSGLSAEGAAALADSYVAGAGTGAGIGGGAGAAMSYGGAGDFASSVPGASVSASDALGMSGSAAGALGVPNPVTGAPTPTGTPVVPGAPAPAPTPGTPAPAGAPAAGGGITGIPQVDDALNWMKKNASWLAPTAIGAAGLLKKPTALPNQAQLEALGTEGAGVAKQLITQYQSGQLQPGQQASLDQLTQHTKNQIRQYFASIHQSDSTAALQAEAQVDQQATIMKQQMLDNALQQGLQAIGVAQGPLNTIAQYQLGQDQALRQAFGTFASAIGTGFGRQAGSTATPTPTGTPSQPTGTVTSTPEPSPAET